MARIDLAHHYKSRVCPNPARYPNSLRLAPRPGPQRQLFSFRRRFNYPAHSNTRSIKQIQGPSTMKHRTRNRSDPGIRQSSGTRNFSRPQQSDLTDSNVSRLSSLSGCLNALRHVLPPGCTPLQPGVPILPTYIHPGLKPFANCGVCLLQPEFAAAGKQLDRITRVLFVETRLYFRQMPCRL